MAWANFFCRHRYVFYLGMVLFCVLIFLAVYRTTRFRCWAWTHDPSGAMDVERASRIDSPGKRRPPETIADVSTQVHAGIDGGMDAGMDMGFMMLRA